MTLGMPTSSIMTLSMTVKNRNTQHNRNQYLLFCSVSFMLRVAYKPTMLSIVMLNVVLLSVIMQSVVMLSVVMLSVVMLSVVMLSVVMQSVIMLSVVMVSVVVPILISFGIILLNEKKLSQVFNVTSRNSHLFQFINSFTDSNDFSKSLFLFCSSQTFPRKFSISSLIFSWR
jgi:hypothetical protein